MPSMEEQVADIFIFLGLLFVVVPGMLIIAELAAQRFMK